MFFSDKFVRPQGVTQHHIFIEFIFWFRSNFLAYFARISYFKFLELKEFNKTIIPFALVGYETGYSQLSATHLVGGAEMAQWWEHSPPTNMARVQFPDPASNVGWVCWFSSLHQEVFSRYSSFPSPQKPKFDLIVLIVNLSYSVPN